MNKRVYQCSNTIESIFTAIYDAWASKYGHANIRIDIIMNNNDDFNFELFTEYISVEEDFNKANKVANSIGEKISKEAYDLVMNAACSSERNKGDIIYRFLILGFSVGSNVVNYLTNEAVMNIFELNRNVSMERHHFLGFLRFIQIKSSVLFAKIKPKNDILRMIATHFSERLPNEDFIIYDEGRNSVIIHPANKQWIYTKFDDNELEQFLSLEENDEEYSILWRTFFDSISIKERRNLKLQRNNLPLRYRSNMDEFKSKNKGK